MRSATAAPRRAIIFDLDGTLVDSAKGIGSALDEVRASRGMKPVALDDVRRWVSRGAEDLVTFALESSPACLDADLAAFRAAYAKIPANPDDLYPGALATLAGLRERGFGLGVCTNKPQGLAASLVHGLGLGALTTVVVGGAPGMKPKPDPESLNLVLSRLDVSRDASLYVGDSEVDADTAHAAGVPFVLVGHGYAIGPRDRIACTAVIQNLGDLLPLTDSLR